jgi:outer membrane protein assembly factor BamA
MKIAVMTGFPAEGDMNVNACHKSKMDYTCFLKMSNLALYRLIVVMIGSLLTTCSVAQLQLKIEPAANEVKTTVAGIQFKTNFKSRLELEDYLRKLPAILQAKGYLSASIDSIAEKETTTIAYLFLGKQYRWSQLNIKPEDQLLLNDLGYSFPSSKIADAFAISTLPQKIIDHYQDNGYPFAKVKWDSIQLSNDEISASLLISKGPLYKMDSIGMYGSVKMSKSFLIHYLNLPDDGLYRQSVLNKIDQKLLELPYVQQSQPWSISMQSTGYVLNFYLQPKRSNQVDALIGLLPASSQNGGKLLLTVDAKIVLQNAFGAGEFIDFNWQQIQPKSPRLHLVYQQPYIFNSNFGLDFAFQLYKKDSSFLNVIGDAGIQYKLGDHQSASVLLQLQRTNLLDIDTTTIKFNRRLPDIIDLGITNIGVTYSFINTNYRLNPRKGTELSFITTAGNKTIRKNNAITNIKDGSFNYSRLYDSLQLNSYQVRFRMNAAEYFPIAKRAAIKTALQAGFIQTPNFFRNEMFQVGGYRLLRGFDEESIFADKFAVATFEYRYLTDLNSFFFGFTDLGWTNFKTEQANISHTYIGAGAGMAFQAKQGVFNISYAVGKRDDLKFNLRQSKIHLGYTSFF